MRNGRAYRQVLWAPVIKEIGGGLLPTPKASDGERGRDKARNRPDTKARELATTVRDQMLPTPVARDWKGRSTRNGVLPNSFVPTGGGYASEPVLCRGDDGLSSRVDRLKALGNAVVPQVAAIPLARVKELSDNALHHYPYLGG